MPIDEHDVALIKGMLLRGLDRQSDIAAFFGGDINSGRVSEIHTRKKYAEISAAPPHELPPPGPYMAAKSALKAKRTLELIKEIIDEALRDIEASERE